MSDEIMLLLALVVSTAGMASFAMSISAHWRQIYAHRPQSQGLRFALRGVGAVLIGIAFLICATTDPFMMAILVWPMLLMVGAVIVAAAFALHGYSRRLRKGEDDKAARAARS